MLPAFEITHGGYKGRMRPRFRVKNFQWSLALRKRLLVGRLFVTEKWPFECCVFHLLRYPADRETEEAIFSLLKNKQDYIDFSQRISFVSVAGGPT